MLITSERSHCGVHKRQFDSIVGANKREQNRYKKHEPTFEKENPRKTQHIACNRIT